MNLKLLARITHSRYKNYSHSLFISIVLASVFILFFISISQSVKSIFENVAEDNLLAKRITVMSFYDDSDGNSIKNTPSDESIRIIANNENVEQVCVRYQLFGRNMSITIDSNNISINSLIKGVDPLYKTFTKLDIETVYGKNEPSGNPIISGKDFQSDDIRVALVDENFVYLLGYKEASAVIGKTINIVRGLEKIVDIKIIGVYDYRFGSMPTENLRYFPEGQLELMKEGGWELPIIVSKDVIHFFSPDYTSGVIYSSGLESITYEVGSIAGVEDVYNHIKNYTNNHIVSSLQSTKQISDQLRNISIFVFVLSGIMLIVSLLTIINSTLSKVYNQRRILKMMLVMGYTPMDIVKMYSIDNLFTIVKSIMTYIISIYLITFIVEYLLKETYVSLLPNANNIFVVDLLTVLLYSVMLLIISLITCALFTKKCVNKLIKINCGVQNG